MALAKVIFENLFGRRSESGTAAIEFALFLPFLLLLLTGVAELGFAMYEAMQVNNAVEAGSSMRPRTLECGERLASAAVGASVIARRN